MAHAGPRFVQNWRSPQLYRDVRQHACGNRQLWFCSQCTPGSTYSPSSEGDIEEVTSLEESSDEFSGYYPGL
eukprot:55097-Prorocentrum_minimum.AAC.1